MKTTAVQENTSFDVQAAESRVNEIRSKNSELNSECERIINNEVQILLQIILRNVSINKNSQIALIAREDSFEIKYIYDLESKHNRAIKISFAQKSDVMTFGDEMKGTAKEKGINIGDIYDVDFDSISTNLLRNGSIDDMDCVILYGYIANEIKTNGDFITVLMGMYRKLRVLWSEINNGFSEARTLNENKQKHFLNIYKNEFSKKIKENTVIIVKDHKKEFVHFTAIKVHRLQNTTGYFTHEYGETKKIFNTSNKQLYGLLINTNHDWNEKRHKIEEIIDGLARNKYEGDKVEFMSWDDYLAMKSQISEEREKISNGELPKCSEEYLRINHLNR